MVTQAGWPRGKKLRVRLAFVPWLCVRAVSER
jgi:hypothetical protein